MDESMFAARWQGRLDRTDKSTRRFVASRISEPDSEPGEAAEFPRRRRCYAIIPVACRARSFPPARIAEASSKPGASGVK